LPGEREFAEQLGVSRASMREALRTLASMGLLETRPGSGTLVSTSSANLLKTPFELMLMLDQPPLHELYETRELLEVHLAGRAAEHRTEDDLAAIQGALQHMRKHLMVPAEVNKANVRFHEAIAAAAHHSVLERIMTSLHEGIRLSVEATQPAVRDWESVYEIHHRIFDAVQRKDIQDARRAMTIHMAMAFDELSRISVGGNQSQKR
jgi:GntR family transcriptional repressor for pyruvate dehydrogenase complex